LDRAPRELRELVNEYTRELEDPHEVAQVQALFSVVVAWSNWMTHETELSGRAYQAEDPNDPDVTDDTMILIIGPSRHQVFDAMHFASASHLLLLNVVVERFAPWLSATVRRATLSTALRRADELLWRAWKDRRHCGPSVMTARAHVTGRERSGDSPQVDPRSWRAHECPRRRNVATAAGGERSSRRSSRTARHVALPRLQPGALLCRGTRGQTAPARAHCNAGLSSQPD
jgi:hypothetical protein